MKNAKANKGMCVCVCILRFIYFRERKREEGGREKTHE